MRIAIRLAQVALVALLAAAGGDDLVLGGTSPSTARLRAIMLSLRSQDEECTRAG